MDIGVSQWPNKLLYISVLDISTKTIPSLDSKHHRGVFSLEHLRVQKIVIHILRESNGESHFGINRAALISTRKLSIKREIIGYISAAKHQPKFPQTKYVP